MPPAWFSLISDSKRGGQAGRRQAKPSRSDGCRRLRLEPLEIRSLLSVSALGEAVPYYVAPAADNGVVPSVHRRAHRVLAGADPPRLRLRQDHLQQRHRGGRRQRHDDRHRGRLR